MSDSESGPDLNQSNGAEAWMIDQSSIQYIKCISEDIGSTAIIYLAEMCNMKGRHAVAVKQMRDMEDETVIHRELCVLTSVSHNHIVKLFGIVADVSPVQLCLEYCEGGSLFELLHIAYHIPLSWLQRLTILRDTADAIDHLHSYDPKIVHRDLKSLNILLLHRITSQHDMPHTKVCDFGFAREYEPNAIMTKGAGTPQWMAPEVFASTEYTEAADVFSFAIVAFEVVCRRVPSVTALAKPGGMPHMRSHDTRSDFSQAVRMGHRPDLTDPKYLPQVVPKGLIDLVKSCWAQKPMDRPSFRQIRQHLEKVIADSPDDVKNFVPVSGVQSI